VITVIRLGHVARMGKREKCIKFWSENLKRKADIGDTGEEVLLILKWMLRKKDVREWTNQGQGRTIVTPEPQIECPPNPSQLLTNVTYLVLLYRIQRDHL
jgi:hypothetical protein